jgi:hypothetical protein
MTLFLALILIAAGLFLQGTALGSVLFIGGMILVLFSISGALDHFKNQHALPVDPCTLHQWDYDEKEQLFCKVCRKKPSEIETSYDKPY